MFLEPVDATDPRAVLRGLRGAVLGAGPAIALDASAAGAVPGPGTPPLPVEVPPGTAVVVTTSGSTGYPKRVAISRSALTSSALATAARIGEGDWLLALPAGYIAGVQVLARALIAGREPAILAGSFSATAFAAAAAAMASSVGGVRVPTYTSLVPAQLATLLHAEAAGVPTHLSSFAAVLVGGQALPPSLLERAEAVGARIVRTYGASETSGGCVYDGVPLDGVEVRIVTGEVQLTGPVLADGYLGDPERTAQAFVVDAARRWYRTGDAGALDDGVLRVTGRLDNVIVSGGINVSLDRIEHAVRGVPGLERAVVVPAASTRWGQVPVIVVAGVSEADAGELLPRARRAAEDLLGVAGRPARIDIVAELPRLASGKPDRRALLPRPVAE